MLVTKIKERKARIGVIGLGYVGLPLLIEFGKSGFPVTGLDIDTKKINHLLQGKSYIRHITGESILALNSEKTFLASTDFSLASGLV